ncbi:MAG: hypothetical protein LBR86_03980 [Tannerella sp.]|nr:hypothetical protein [Tannerella sp.]
MDRISKYLSSLVFERMSDTSERYRVIAYILIKGSHAVHLEKVTDRL